MSLVPSLSQDGGGNISRTERHGADSAPPSAAVDVVAVYGADGEQLFPLARPSKATVTQSAKIAEHPVESSGTIADNRVFEPVKIELKLFVTECASTYARLQAAFFGNELLTVQTRAALFENMAIEKMPHDEVPESLGVLTLGLELREVRLIRAQFQALPPAKVREARDASTIDRGQQCGKAAEGSGKSKSAAVKLFG